MTEWRYCTSCGAALRPSLVSPDLKDTCPACGWFRATYAMPVALVLAHTEDARVVLARRRDWPDAAWALVAGYVELGESAEDAALRELREETGLEGRNPRVRRTLVRDDLLLVCVEVDIDDARPEALSDIDEAILATDAADRIPREWPAHTFCGGLPGGSPGGVTHARMKLQRGLPAGRAYLMLLLTIAATVPLSLALVAGGAVGGAWWMPLFTWVGLGYASARLLSAPFAIPVATVAGPASVCLVILVKTLTWPKVPAVGDGFPILLMLFAATGALAAAATYFIKRSARALRRQLS